MRTRVVLVLVAVCAAGLALAWTARDGGRAQRGAPVGEPGVAAVQARPEGSAPDTATGRGAKRRLSRASRASRASPADRAIAWRRSRALGTHAGGQLVRGVRLPAAGRHFVTWDPVLRRTPNRAWRRWGTDRLVRTVLRVLRRHRHAHPGAPRVAVGDLSRPRGGDFGRRYGPLGHASHQNGLDVDVYYPRLDGLERKPFRPAQVDRRLAQDLVDSFVAAGAERVFVGPSLGLRGPPRVVQALAHHDDHLHVRLPL